MMMLQPSSCCRRAVGMHTPPCSRLRMSGASRCISAHCHRSCPALLSVVSRGRTTTSKDLFASADSMNKRIPTNTKFAHVKSTLNTGANTGNVKVKVDRSGEMFRRVNRRQLHQLMIACESGDESIYALQERWDEVEDNDELASVRSGRSSVGSIGSTSSMNSTVIMTHTAREGSAAQVAASAANDHFLLLDVRDDDAAFARFHIDGAVHYTPAMLRRDHFTPQLYKFKNAENKLIILYDSDETSRIALECCALFLQKGFLNIFLLTGGIKHFGEKYYSRIVGDAPPPPPRVSSSSSGSASSHGRSGSGSVSNRSQALAGAPMSGRPGASALMGSARPASSASQQQFRPSTAASSASHMQQQQGRGFGAGANPATSLSSHRGPSAASATHLGGGCGGGRESPRDVLGRQQQSQMSQPATPSSQQQHQRTRSTPSGAAAASSSQISSRAFR